MGRRKMDKLQVERRKQELIRKLQGYCVGGVAPSTADPKVKSLCKAAYSYWPTWAAFCKAAGVEPAKKTPNQPRIRHNNLHRKGQLREATGYTDVFDLAEGCGR